MLLESKAVTLQSGTQTMQPWSRSDMGDDYIHPDALRSCRVGGDVKFASESLAIIVQVLMTVLVPHLRLWNMCIVFVMFDGTTFSMREAES